MKRVMISALALIAGASAACAQEANVFTAEGTIKEIVASGTPVTSAEMKCAGMTFTVNANTVMSTPVKTITLAQLTSGTDFTNAGFNPTPATFPTAALRNGFRGGTCIATGSVTAGAQAGTFVYTATSLLVEIAENVIVGPSTPAVAPYVFAVMGVPVTTITNARMSAGRMAPGYFRNTVATLAAKNNPLNSAAPELPTDGFATGLAATKLETVLSNQGFGVNGAAIPVGTLSSADGYVGTDDVMYAHTINADGPLLRTHARATILRNSCNIIGRARDTVDASGGCVFAPGSTATTSNITLQVRVGTAWVAPGSTVANSSVTATCNRIAGTSEGKWVYRGAQVTLGTCPTAMRATVAGAISLVFPRTPADTAPAPPTSQLYDVKVGF